MPIKRYFLLGLKEKSHLTIACNVKSQMRISKIFFILRVIYYGDYLTVKFVTISIVVYFCIGLLNGTPHGAANGFARGSIHGLAIGLAWQQLVIQHWRC